MTLVDRNIAILNKPKAIDGRRGRGFEITQYRGDRGYLVILLQFDEVPGLPGTHHDAKLGPLDGWRTLGA